MNSKEYILLMYAVPSGANIHKGAPRYLQITASNASKSQMISYINSWFTKSPTSKAESNQVNPLNPQGLKPCCACPETKSARDECFLQHDAVTAEEACKDLVRRHVECMRSYGFKI